MLQTNIKNNHCISLWFTCALYVACQNDYAHLNICSLLRAACGSVLIEQKITCDACIGLCSSVSGRLLVCLVRNRWTLWQGCPQQLFEFGKQARL